jgi:hypothetical protein
MRLLRYRRLWTVVLVALLGVAGLAWLTRTRPAPRTLNVEGFHQLQRGMTQDEVEALLGGPPGDYGQYPSGGFDMTAEGFVCPSGSVEKLWYDDDHRFEIFFGDEGKLAGVFQRGSHRWPGNSRWQEFRRLLGEC